MNLRERARLFLALDVPREEKLDGYEGLVRELAESGSSADDPAAVMRGVEWYRHNISRRNVEEAVTAIVEGVLRAAERGE